MKVLSNRTAESVINLIRGINNRRIGTPPLQPLRNGANEVIIVQTTGETEGDYFLANVVKWSKEIEEFVTLDGECYAFDMGGNDLVTGGYYLGIKWGFIEPVEGSPRPVVSVVASVSSNEVEQDGGMVLGGSAIVSCQYLQNPVIPGSWGDINDWENPENSLQYLVHPAAGGCVKWLNRGAMLSSLGIGGSDDDSLEDLGITTDADIYSPFGGSLLDSGVPCVVYSDMTRGRGSSPQNTIVWTHIIDFALDATVNDATDRVASLNTLNYYDGDEVRLAIAGYGDRYVVCFAGPRATDDGVVWRTYCLRHSFG